MKLRTMLFISALLVLSPLSHMSVAAASPLLQQQEGTMPSDFDAQISDLSKQISGEIGENKGTKVAVIEFADLDGKTSELGKFLAEEIITRLYQTRKFKVIERQLLNKILREQKFELTGPVDAEAAKKIGNLLGVEAIITGTITDLPSSVRINARLISTTTGIIFGVASTTITKDTAIRSLMGNSSTSPKVIRTTTRLVPDRQSSSNGLAVKSHSFTFECMNVRRRGNGVVLADVLVTNLDENTRITIGKTVWGTGRTRILASSGRSYELSDIYIGRPMSGDGGFLPVSRQQGIREHFTSGVPTLVTMRFNDASNDFGQLNVLDLIVSGLNGKNDEIIIRLKIPQH